MAAVTAATGTAIASISGTLPVTSGVSPWTAYANYNPGVNTYANGTAANSIDIVYSSITAMAASASTFDLFAVSDISAVARVPLRCRELWAWIIPTDTTLTHVVGVAPGASSGWSYAPTMTMFPGGFYRLCHDPISVGAATGAIISNTSKTIKFDPGAFTITLYLIGYFCSAAT